MLLGLMLVGAARGPAVREGARVAGIACTDTWRRRSSSSIRAETARLKRISDAVDEGKINDIEVMAVNAVGGPEAATYGEVTPKGFTTIALKMGLGEDSHFADLGSGTGKAVMQAASQFGVAAAVGVELSNTRHERAMLGLSRADPMLASTVRFVQADCAGDAVWAADGPLCDTTDVWLCSLLFGPQLMERLAERIADSLSVERVATLKPFPSGLRGFAMDENAEPCEMSWTAKLIMPADEPSGSPVHFYRRIQ